MQKLHGVSSAYPFLFTLSPFGAGLTRKNDAAQLQETRTAAAAWATRGAGEGPAMIGGRDFRPADGRSRRPKTVPPRRDWCFSGEREPNAPGPRGRPGPRARPGQAHSEPRSPHARDPAKRGANPPGSRTGATHMRTPALLRIVSPSAGPAAGMGVGRREGQRARPGPRSGAAMVAAGRDGPEILNGLLRASCAFRRGEVLFPGDLSRFRCQTTVAPTKKGELVSGKGAAARAAKRSASPFCAQARGRPSQSGGSNERATG